MKDQKAVVVGFLQFALICCFIHFKLLNLCHFSGKPNCRVVLAFSHPKEGTKLKEVPLLHRSNVC